MNDISDIYKEKLAIAYAIGFGIVTAAAYFLIFNMDLKNYNNIDNGITALKHNSRVLNEIGKYDAFVKEFSAAFAETKSPNWIIDTITDNIKTLDIKLETIRPMEPQVISGFKIVRIQVGGSGDFKDVARLISVLEHQKKYLFIEDMDLTPVTISQEMGPGGRDQAASAPRRISKFRLTVSGVNSE